MRVQLVKMFKQGVEIEKRLLNDRYTQTHRGRLVTIDATDQGRHKPMKVARLLGAMGSVCELYDVQVVWASDGRITFTGDERVPNDGKLVHYKQSGLCLIDTDS
jgi:hypothetical protein